MLKNWRLGRPGVEGTVMAIFVTVNRVVYTLAAFSQESEKFNLTDKPITLASFITK